MFQYGKGALIAVLSASICLTNNARVSAFSPVSNDFRTRQSSPLEMVSNTIPADIGSFTEVSDTVSEENPLRVLISGAGVGGLVLARELSKNKNMEVTVLEKTDEFKRFGGPIQLASNALQILKDTDSEIYDEVMKKFTFTGDKMNGIKDGIRNEWYAKFDLAGPAEARNMPYTGVIERPDLQQIFLDAMPPGVINNGDGIASYETNSNGFGVKAIMESGKTVEGDVLIGADGIWSSVRASMRDEPARGEKSGATYSGYTVFAGELNYDSFDNGDVGYKVYIGPGQYFVITDIGNGRYQWYAFLARPSGATYDAPDGTNKYLGEIFEGWSKDIHHILDATKEEEIEQRDLYDRPPSVMKPWTKGPVALLGDAIHAMMPNLGQGGCQAIEDSFVLAQELGSLTSRNDIEERLNKYKSRRLIRSAAVQGLSRFASDIIIRGFDTPAKIVFDGGIKFENFNYAGIVTKLLQPILPIFFLIQFNFLYEGWKNELAIDVKASFGFLLFGGIILALLGGSAGEFGVFLFGLDEVIGEVATKVDLL